MRSLLSSSDCCSRCRPRLDPGRDVILGKGGADAIHARDGQRDVIDCETERDVAIVDRLDVVKHCETVVRRKP